jgi:hypothetical protein
MPLSKIPPSHAIITSSSNMLHASSMNNHSQRFIESNHTYTSGIHWLWHEIHTFSVQNIFRVGHKLLIF